MSGSRVPTPSREFLELQRFLAGRYSILRELGRGGTSTVFLAREVGLDRPVAIKLLRPELLADDEARARLVREARTAAGLLHPNIVPVHRVEETAQGVFLVMAYVEGESLGRRVRRAGPLSPMAVRRVMTEVTWALEHAHREGVVHLDVKPDNILLERATGRTLVTDFGIARHLDRPGSGPRSGSASEGEEGGEGDGAASSRPLVGTAAYMSPEQLADQEVGPRSDFYSLGVTAYFALTGRHPFPVPEAGAPVERHLAVRDQAARVSDEGFPPRLAAVVDACLEPRPGERPASAAELSAALEETEVLTSRLPREGDELLRSLRTAVVLTGVAIPFLLIWPRPVVAVLTGMGAAIWSAGLLGPARRLVRKGLDAAMIRRILDEEAREWAADLEGDAAGWGERLLDRLRDAAVRWGPAPLALAAAGWALLEPAFLPAHEVGPPVAFLLAAALLFGAGPLPPLGSPARKLDLGERLLVGRFGRLLLKVAGVGLAPDERQDPSSRPTEALLAGKLEDGFRRLPPEFRRRLEDLPDVARRLEARVQELRRRDEELARAQARIHLPAGGGGHQERERMQRELEDRRAEVARRLAGGVGALEHLRIELARLARDPTGNRVEALTMRLTRALEEAGDPGAG